MSQISTSGHIEPETIASLLNLVSDPKATATRLSDLKAASEMHVAALGELKVATAAFATQKTEFEAKLKDLEARELALANKDKAVAAREVSVKAAEADYNRRMAKLRELAS
jgi:hypothetical protein